MGREPTPAERIERYRSAYELANDYAHNGLISYSRGGTRSEPGRSSPVNIGPLKSTA